MAEDKLKDPLRFLLPDLLGKPYGMTAEEGEMTVWIGKAVQLDCYICFYSI